VEIHIFEVESILMLQHYISIALCICIEVCRDLMVRLVPVQHLRMQLHTLLGMRTEGSAWHSICIHIIEVELKFIVLILYVECKSLLSKPVFFLNSLSKQSTCGDVSSHPLYIHSFHAFDAYSCGKGE
jgi:hypothetical protein